LATFNILYTSAQQLNSKHIDFSVYENSTFRIKINYPSNWEPNDETFDPDNMRIRFNAPNESNYNENVRIDINNLIDYKGTTIEEIIQEDYSYDTAHDQFHIIEPVTKRDINGSEAASIIYSYNLDFNETLIVLMIDLIHQDRIYNIAYYANKENYSDYANTVWKMIQSLTTLPKVEDSQQLERRVVNPVFQQYVNPILDLQFTYPEDWKIVETNDIVKKVNTIKIISPSKTYSDRYKENIIINKTDLSSSLPISQQLENFISSSNNYDKKNFLFWKILDYKYNYTNLTNTNYYIHSIGKDNVSNIETSIKHIWILDNYNLYELTIRIENSKTEYYEPIINQILQSLETSIKSMEKRTTPTYYNQVEGIKVGKYPTDLSFNPNTNNLYVANAGSNTISVIDTSNDNIITTITTEFQPVGLQVNPNTNRLYVASYHTVSVFDGTNYSKIGNINISSDLFDITIDANDDWIFVSTLDTYSSNIFVIDGKNYSQIIKIPLGLSFLQTNIGMTVNSFTNTLYVTQGNTLHKIEYLTNKTSNFEYKTLEEFEFNTNLDLIATNPNTNILYITDSLNGQLLVVNGSTNTIVKTLPIGVSPWAVTVNPFTNKIFISDLMNNTIHIVNGQTLNVEAMDIPIGLTPSDIALNIKDNILYISNSGSSSISMLDGKSNKILVGIKYIINPPNSGYLDCNKRIISNTTYIRYELGRISLNCIAKANSNFAFSHWSGNLPSNKSLSIFHDFDYIISPWFGSLASNSSISPITTIDSSKNGIVSVNFIPGLTFIQRYGTEISNISLLIFIVIPLLFAFPSLVSNKIEKKAFFNKSFFNRLFNGLTKPFTYIEDLSNSEIIQIDASVIVGVLILLSLTGIARSQINNITANIIFPFALSAVFIILSRQAHDVIVKKETSNVTRSVVNVRKDISIRFMMAGFVNLMISIILLVIMG
jgi:YVTN family beta-propeller protein